MVKIGVATAMLALIGAAVVLAFRHKRHVPSSAGTFAVFQGQLDGRPVFATVDTSLRSFPEKSQFPYFLSIKTKLESPTPEGLTTDSEADTLNAWEDTVDTRLRSVGKVAYVGRLTWNGQRELLYYTNSDRPFEKALTELRDSKSMRPFAFSLKRDDSWGNANLWLNPHP